MILAPQTMKIELGCWLEQQRHAGMGRLDARGDHARRASDTGSPPIEGVGPHDFVEQYRGAGASSRKSPSPPSSSARLWTCPRGSWDENTTRSEDGVGALAGILGTADVSPHRLIAATQCSESCPRER